MWCAQFNYLHIKDKNKKRKYIFIVLKFKRSKYIREKINQINNKCRKNNLRIF